MRVSERLRQDQKPAMGLARDQRCHGFDFTVVTDRTLDHSQASGGGFGRCYQREYVRRGVWVIHDADARELRCDTPEKPYPLAADRTVPDDEAGDIAAG